MEKAINSDPPTEDIATTLWSIVAAKLRSLLYGIVKMQN
jgi:hypothetical protein